MLYHTYIYMYIICILYYIILYYIILYYIILYFILFVKCMYIYIILLNHQSDLSNSPLSCPAFRCTQHAAVALHKVSFEAFSEEGILRY